jgi:hypothetical protein
MELWRFEGISFNRGNNKLYAALTNIGSGMLNNATTHDRGGPNHIRVAANICGCVMELDVDPSNMRLTKARMTVCGIPKTDAASKVVMGTKNMQCDPNGIASPDNVAVIPGYNQVSAVSESVIMQYACTEPQWYLMLFGVSSASHR